MAVKGSFKYGDQSIKMEMGYGLATGKMEDLGIDILGIISDGGVTIKTILLDDRTLLKIWYHYVNEQTDDSFDKAIEILDETEGGLENFRDEFYKLVINFSPPQAREYLRETWKQIKKEMNDSKKVKSMISSTPSPEEQE